MAQETGIKTYSLKIAALDIYKTVNSLMAENIRNGTVPYFKENPLPQDMNIVNGRHSGDINKILIELKAAKIGAKSLRWIYGADASLLGLELKANGNNPSFDTEPLVCFANMKKNGSELDAQCVYLLDQFSDESIRGALKFTRTEQHGGM